MKPNGPIFTVLALPGRISDIRVDAIDKTWGTPPLIWALTGWSRKPATDAGRYYQVVALLVAAGAKVTPALLESDKVRADPKIVIFGTSR